jgi:hypothetical protein
MRKVLKYKIDTTEGEQILSVPESFKVIAFKQHHSSLRLFIEGDLEKEKTELRLYVVATGEEVPANHFHIGTVILNNYAYHLYQKF